MAKILILNSGSSSIKFQLINMPEEDVITTGMIDRISSEDGVFSLAFNGNKIKEYKVFENHNVGIKYILKRFIDEKIITDLSEIEACGHRVAHGGEYFKGSAVIDEISYQKIKDNFELAPLHNPANLNGYDIIHEILPNIINVATFDTAFHMTTKEDVFLYPIPYKYYELYKIRKYGFHGTSHKYVSEKARELNADNKKIITCHLGNGVSICAIDNGISVNTSMGLTPLGGTVMGTRSGNIDPGVVEYISKVEKIDVSQTLNILNKESGIFGISGISNDVRDIIAASKKGDSRAIITLKIYARRISEYIGAYVLQLKGLDALVFTAGVGENSGYVRNFIFENIKDVLNIKIDEELNENNGNGNCVISTDESSVNVYVISTNEELVIARDTYDLLTK